MNKETFFLEDFEPLIAQWEEEHEYLMNSASTTLESSNIKLEKAIQISNCIHELKTILLEGTK